MGKILTKRIASNGNSVLNLVVKQNCGIGAVCIAYRGCDDIDIRFDDGIIVKSRTKQNFLRGAIRHPLLSRSHSRIVKSSCLGKTIMQHCGMEATCIAYRRATDIDIRFNDGTVIKHRHKQDFIKGTIQNPNLRIKMNAVIQKASCLGITKVMNNGMNATCIAYRGWSDIDVQFEDGTVVKHKKKGDFLNGSVESPNWWQKSFPQRVVYECVKKYFPSAIFNYRPKFLKNLNSGLNLELDIWIPQIKSGIEYDGFPWHSKETKFSKLKYELILKAKEIEKIYSLIERGCIEHESPKHINLLIGATSISSKYDVLEKAINNLFSLLGVNEKIELSDVFLNQIREQCKNQNLGMTIKQKCGLNATCIAYREHNDIDVQFEDGTIVKHRAKNNFLKGLIKNPVLYKKKQEESSLNQSILMNNGMFAKCIAYRGTTDIDIQFDDGTIVKHVQKSHFTNGSIKHPMLNARTIRSSCLNVTLQMKNGMNATCILYRNERDIDVQFEDGTVVTHKRKGNFVRGEIDNPNYNRHSCLNEKRLQNCGLIATCIAYRGCNDIDVQFEDGEIVKNKKKQCFLSGNIKHPTINSRVVSSSCLSVTKKMNNGMNATCIAYRGHNDIDVQFEDGFIAKHRRKERFLKGEIAHKVFSK